jgi:putative transposase
MRKIILASGNYYHIYSRGVDRREIYSSNYHRKLFLELMRKYEVGTSGEVDVRVHVYCLMDNHFHLLVEQISDGGVSRYMHRLLGIYVRLFNKDLGRTGRLFESEYKFVPIEGDGQFGQLIRYIHFNPVKALLGLSGVSAKEIVKRASEWKWSNCDEYLKGRGSLQWFFDDVSYRSFLLMSIWIEREPGLKHGYLV